jgi:hypothetical protein
MTSGLKLVENIIGERWKRELPPQYSFVHMKNLKILHVEGEKNVKNFTHTASYSSPITAHSQLGKAEKTSKTSLRSDSGACFSGAKKLVKTNMTGST